MQVETTTVELETDFELSENGNIKQISKTDNKPDRLFAKNGDLIADNIDKRILRDGENIKQNGLLIENLNFSIKDITLNAKVGDFLTKLSIYEQKEISWGFYVNENSKEKNNALIYVASYGSNTEKGSTDAVDMFFGNSRLYWNNHTHPSLNKTTMISTPSSTDMRYARMVKKGNFIWSTVGVSQYDENGKIMKSSTQDLVRQYSSPYTKDYVNSKSGLGWKKKF